MNTTRAQCLPLSKSGPRRSFALTMGSWRTHVTALAAIGVALPAWADGIERFEPAAFINVPVAVRTGLQRLGCTVPQSFMAKQPENVIQGSFTARGSREWAALCSVNGASDILVFRSESPEPVARFGKQADDLYVQVIAPGRSGFSRLLAAGPASADGTNPIHDAFIEKASVVWVRVGKRWQSKASVD